MILHLNKSVSTSGLEQLNGFYFEKEDHYVAVTSSSNNQIPDQLRNNVIEFHQFDSDIQLASRDYLNGTRTVKIGDVSIGGDTGNTIVIAGPCSVESVEQINGVGELLNEKGLKAIRGGCFKPRTSPYSFQGLGSEGLDLLCKVRDQYGHQVVTEVKDYSHVHEVIEKADVIQIGAKAMYDQSILKACSKTHKPVLIKRGFGTTLQEFVQAAEFVLSGGNENVLLCERGIRTFETKTRFTLDLCGVAWLKEYTNLPIILDPSHALGYRYGITDLTKACVAMGVDGMLIEVHPQPEIAKSDAAQQLNFEEFGTLLETIAPVANAVNKSIV